ncbi:MAG: hypothetical protein EOP84_12500 [Verrucomicrobiaceae bacterium]|nr:MAG: hypothetical protein EOP84_12500 [Verrucomicrobiaceae bacterium]
MLCKHKVTFRFRLHPDLTPETWEDFVARLQAWLNEQWGEDGDHHLVYNEDLTMPDVHVYFAEDRMFVLTKIAWMDYL